jgi:serine phosphatase RsbU (regulator of sigma subunit)
MDTQGALFGDAALPRGVEGHRALDATALRDHLVDAVKEFVGEAEPHDDMTMVVMKIGGSAR